MMTGMHPILSEQLGAAHRGELRRLAAAHSYPSTGAARSGPHPHSRLAGARRGFGTLLIRAGQRIAPVLDGTFSPVEDRTGRATVVPCPPLPSMRRSATPF